KTNGRSSRANFVLSITNLHLNGLAPRLLSSAAQFGSEGFNGDIRDANLTLHDGISTSDLPIFLTRRGQVIKVPLRFAGDIDFTTKQLRNYNVTIPAEFFGSEQVVKAFPTGIALPVKVTLNKWSIDTTRLPETMATSAIG